MSKKSISNKNLSDSNSKFIDNKNKINHSNDNMSLPSIHKWRKIVVYGVDFTPELKMMADTITKLKLWDWFKNYSPEKGKGFMWSSHPNISKISNALPQNNHSGATFAYAMRQMEYIAKNGFDNWNKMK